MLGRRRTQASMIIHTDSQRDVSRGNRVGRAISRGQAPHPISEIFRHPLGHPNGTRRWQTSTGARRVPAAHSGATIPGGETTGPGSPSSSVRSSRNALTRASAGRTRRTPGAAGSFRAAQALGGGCAGFPRGRDRHPQDRAAGGHRERDRGQDRFGDASRLWCGSAWFMKAGRPDVWSPDHSDAAASDWRARRQTRERAVLCRCDR